LIPQSKVLFEKLTGPQLVEKFPAYYWNWRFTTVFTRACHLFLFWARLIQSMPLSHFLNTHFNIILSRP